MILKPGILTISDFAPTTVINHRIALVAPHLILAVQLSVERPGLIFGICHVSYASDPLGEDLCSGPNGKGHWLSLYRGRVTISKSQQNCVYMTYPSWEYVNRAADYIRSLKRVKTEFGTTHTISK